MDNNNITNNVIINGIINNMKRHYKEDYIKDQGDYLENYIKELLQEREDNDFYHKVKEGHLWKLISNIDYKKITNTKEIGDEIENILHINKCKICVNKESYFFNKWKNNIKNKKKIKQDKLNTLCNIVLDISSNKV